LNYKIIGASKKFKNQLSPLVRLGSVNFWQNFWNLSHETVPLSKGKSWVCGGREGRWWRGDGIRQSATSEVVRGGGGLATYEVATPKREWRRGGGRIGG
jgi:hypothetical protein